MISHLNERAFRRSFVGVLTFALAIRLIWALIVPVGHVSDPDAYDRLARTLVEHGVYGWTKDEPTAYYPIGTSAFYAAVYWLFGTSDWAVKIVNMLLGLLMIALAMLVASHWFDRRVALIAGALLAAWPAFIQYTTVLASETIFTVALLGSLLAFENLLKTRDRVWWLAALTGALVGVAALIRPPAMLLPAVFGVIYLWERRNVAATAKIVVGMGLAIVVVMAPWAYRNYKLFNVPILSSSSAGANFWMGNNPNTTGFYEQPPPPDPNLNEAVVDAGWAREAVSYIKERPFAFLGRTLVKSVRLYERETIGVHWNAVGLTQVLGAGSLVVAKIISQIYWMAMVVLFAYGCYLNRPAARTWPGLNTGLAVMAYSTAIYAITVIQDRYHIPTNPIMAAFAAVAVAHLLAGLPKTARLSRWASQSFPERLPDAATPAAVTGAQSGPAMGVSQRRPLP
jgi:4-amino-4-deoxy-L-arabinose transferase-like glycosyltransferase